MKISVNWLSEYIDHEKTPEELSSILTSTGLEVEALQPYSSVEGGLEGLLIGHVKEVRKHPGADKLSVTLVDLGEGEDVQIVCGAPNVAAGQTVVVAPVGTTLYPSGGEPFKIKKAKIRGEVSEGMICAEDEIGLGTDHSGIMVLDVEAKPGTPATEVLDVYNDHVLEIGLTPNRGDAASHTGVARDVAAYLRKTVNYPSVETFTIDEAKHKIEIELKNPEDCPRYMGLVMTGLTVAPSPKWLQNKLKAIGLSPINNIVDITNFVMHETGQPLHAFNLSEVEGDKIIVQRAKENSEFVTLDGKTRKMKGHELMICNANQPIGIAGVMGGEGSAIKNDTSAIFIECACFDPASIRKTAKHHNLFTDASFRFERSVDVQNMTYVLMRTAMLMKEIAGGIISSAILDEYPKKINQPEIEVEYAYLNGLAGTEIFSEEVGDILSRLGFEFTAVNNESFKVKVPGYKTDVNRPVDVVEEVMRIFGFNRIPINKRLKTSLTFTGAFNKQLALNTIANQLVSQGFYEIYSNSLTSKELLESYKGLQLPKTVDILNPLTRELNVMRPVMLFSGLNSIHYNINRQNHNLKFFEISSVFSIEKDAYKEESQLALWLTGNTHSGNWHDKGRKTDIYQLKSYVVNLLKKLGIDNATEEETEYQWFDCGVSFQVKDKVLAHAGSVKKKVLKQHDVAQEVFYAQFYLQDIFEIIRKKKTRYSPVNKFPAVKRDLSLSLTSSLTFSKLNEIIRESGRGILRDVQVFDVYEGDKIEAGKKSYSLRLTFMDENKTLTDEQVDKAIGKIVKNLEEKLHVQLRQ